MPDATASATTATQAPVPSTAPATAPKDRRCRSLRVNGLQCNSTALLGQNFCHTHLHYRRPEFPKGNVVVPLLEDHSSIQLVLSQLAHGLFTSAVDPQSARSLAYICQVASSTLPRPVSVRLKPTDEKPKLQKPVSQVTLAPDGELLGPDEAWADPAAPKPLWSFDKWLLDRYCERLKLPIIARYEDVPPSGWLTEDEAQERKADTSAFFHDFQQRIMDARRQADILERLTPEERDACPFGMCSGHGSDLPCKWCRIEMDERAQRAAAAVDDSHRSPAPAPRDTAPAATSEPPGGSPLDFKASAATRHRPRPEQPALSKLRVKPGTHRTGRTRNAERRAPNAQRRPHDVSSRAQRGILCCSLPHTRPAALNALCPVSCAPSPASGGVIKLDNSSNRNKTKGRQKSQGWDGGPIAPLHAGKNAGHAGQQQVAAKSNRVRSATPRKRPESRRIDV